MIKGLDKSDRTTIRNYNLGLLLPILVFIKFFERIKKVQLNSLYFFSYLYFEVISTQQSLHFSC